jgi:TRAP-type C4-dicarboxylate transport system substrate-binding protein
LVYFVSQKETPNIKSLNGVKIWSWEGDKLVSSMIEEMKLVSVPLPLPDVLSSLSTGIIEAAYAPPLGIVSLQWNTKIKYLVDFPIAYSVGAFLVSNKGWKKVPAKYQEVVKKISEKYIAKVSEANISDNEAALESMKQLGVKFSKFPDSDIATGKDLREKIVKKLEGKLFSSEALKILKTHL